MYNSFLFITQAIIALSFVLLAFRLGKIWLITYVAASAVMMNIFVTKGIDIFGLAVTGGNVLYGSIFLATDLLSEHYNRHEARRAVMVGFFASIFFLIMSQMILWYTPNANDFAQGSLLTILSLTPRIVIASMISYLISQNLDVFLFDFIKSKTGQKHLWLRNNGSTWISQLVDSIIFTTLAFAGVYPLFDLILFTYLVKLAVAALDTPFIYLSHKLKPIELKING